MYLCKPCFLFRLTCFSKKLKLCVLDGAVVASIVAAAPVSAAVFVVAAAIVVWSEMTQKQY